MHSVGLRFGRQERGPNIGLEPEPWSSEFRAFFGTEMRLSFWGRKMVQKIEPHAPRIIIFYWKKAWSQKWTKFRSCFLNRILVKEASLF